MYNKPSPEQVKQKLRWLNTPGNTSRSGFPSGRNLAKKYRSPRVIQLPDGGWKYHPLDMMRMGPAEKPRQSNGVYGDMSTFQGGGATTKRPTTDFGYQELAKYKGGRVVTAGAPGRSRNAPKRKAPGLGLPQSVHQDYERKVLAQLSSLRNQLLMSKWIGERLQDGGLRPDELNMIAEIDGFLGKFFPDVNFTDRDEKALSSVLGMIRVGTIKRFIPINNLWRKMESAARTIRNHERTYTPVKIAKAENPGPLTCLQV